MHGSGTYHLTAGHKYEGEFFEGKKKGMGKFIWKNKDTFEGSHNNHDSHGSGKYTFSNNGEYFEGEYRYGKQNGRGMYHYANGDLFIGDYINGNLHGIGLMIYKNGGEDLREYRNGNFMRSIPDY
uniref:MORN repeat protein n=1 Tax=Euplotes harpa TaxID=151035 RepID=A0A7S3NB35_9SPIT|mmetsp:Transcript_32244/g.36762  ORF Transcript_32244/g.36762 Transcript_32244/m.36762 type:complete len:125 (+) Transcript_32244:166-540(+)